MPRALISVSDKRGIVSFAEGLIGLGWEIISTGGTAAALRAAGLAVTTVETVTGFPELLDGRVKTLHPAVHGALLARRDSTQHMAAIASHGIVPIDLVAVNLYPFQMTIARPGVVFADAVENIDVGGPSMLRSAAKNHEFVLPVVDPVDYPKVLEMLRRGEVTAEARRDLAAKVFAHTAEYDAAIAGFLTPKEEGLPRRLGVSMERVQTLRYGENPSQRAALYVTQEPRGMRDLTQRQGKELSFNNLLDVDAAMWTVACWTNRPACSVGEAYDSVRHRRGCIGSRGLPEGSCDGPGVGLRLRRRPQHGRGSCHGAGDERSFHRSRRGPLLSRGGPRALRRQEIAPRRRAAGQPRRGHARFQTGAGRLPRPGSVRVRSVRHRVDGGHGSPADGAGVERPALCLGRRGLRQVERDSPRARRDGDRDRCGSDEPGRRRLSRGSQGAVDGHDPAGSVLASDGFFPFADGVEQAAAAGVTAIVQPGGSVRDAEVIEAANRYGMAMVMTGRREFRH